MLVSGALVGCGAHADEDVSLQQTNQDVVVVEQRAIPTEVVAKRQAEVASWQAERSRGWRIVESLEMPSGQVLDFVDVTTLYPEGADLFAEPPPSRTALPGEATPNFAGNRGSGRYERNGTSPTWSYRI